MYIYIYFFFKVMPSFFPQAPLNQFLSRMSILCTLYTHFWVFIAISLCIPRQDLLTICTLCWDVLWLVPIASTCYSLYPLLVCATGCSHYWYVLQVVAITGRCYKLYPLLVHATSCTHYQDMITICTHYWDMLWLVSINFYF